MDLYFTSSTNLDNPSSIIKPKDVFDLKPFYKDYYAVIYLKKTSVPIEGFLPVLINDQQLIKKFGANNLPVSILRVVSTQEVIFSKRYKVVYRVLFLKNDVWCLYIEKQYLWKYFNYTGTTVILSHDKMAVFNYYYMFVNLCAQQSKKS